MNKPLSSIVWPQASAVKEIVYKSGTGAPKVKVHGVIIFNGWNYSSNKLQE
ncbi:hypothetical protein Hanom_Chr12g01128521 [Helianthus anomalus]